MPVYKADAIVDILNMEGDITALRDDDVYNPDTYDIIANYGGDVMVEISFPTPANKLTGTQEIRFNSVDTYSLGVDVFVRENGSDIVPARQFIGTGVHSHSFDASALSDPSGMNLTIQFYGVWDYFAFGAWEALRAVEFITNEETATTAPPIVTIVSMTRDTISDEAGYDRTDITFSFDQDVQTAKVMLGGVSEVSGVLVEEFPSGAMAGQELTVTVDWTELGGEGENRINIYGRNSNGEWTPYEG